MKKKRTYKPLPSDDSRLVRTAVVERRWNRRRQGLTVVTCEKKRADEDDDLHHGEWRRPNRPILGRFTDFLAVLSFSVSEINRAGDIAGSRFDWFDRSGLTVVTCEKERADEDNDLHYGEWRRVGFSFSGSWVQQVLYLRFNGG
ncbi:hypothetical protein PIB30_079404 [Stylosanthes scabra]|uniref:Uncharacterized protein n=1 Tax=Stylosanthes scabra TaxID=79078 RepID=A0ABU6SSD4_9FABA|nr:hypothetical protein [Stylosanthes scabra]